MYGCKVDMIELTYMVWICSLFFSSYFLLVPIVLIFYLFIFSCSSDTNPCGHKIQSSANKAVWNILYIYIYIYIYIYVYIYIYIYIYI